MDTIRFAPITLSSCKDFALSVPIHEILPDTYQPMIDITIVTITGKRIPFAISKYDTIDRLKKRMYCIENFLIDSQKYVFKGKALNDSNTLDHYGITTGSSVHLHLRLRGGMYHSTSSRADWVSTNFTTKFQEASHMIRHMRTHGIGLDLMDDLQKMIDKCSTDDEINPLFELIKRYYGE